jgi:hypothetical protein
LAEQISDCWAVDGGGSSVSDIVVEIKIRVDNLGIVRMVTPANGLPTDQRALAVYESARRALLSPACNPLKVPPQKYAALNDSIFRFNPRQISRSRTN